MDELDLFYLFEKYVPFNDDRLPRAFSALFDADWHCLMSNFG